MKTLIRLGGCPGRSESSLGTHFVGFVMSLNIAEVLMCYISSANATFFSFIPVTVTHGIMIVCCSKVQSIILWSYQAVSPEKGKDGIDMMMTEKIFLNTRPGFPRT